MKKVIDYLISILIIILSIGYFVFTLLTSGDLTNQLEVIIKTSILSIFSIVFVIMYLFIIHNKKGSIYAYITSVMLIIFFSINLVTDADILKLPQQETINDFTSVNVTEALEWASLNNITVDQVYEPSDIVPIYHIINQSITPGTLTKEISKIELVISTGPSLDKQLIIPSMIGWNIEEVTKYIENNYLSEVTIEYELSGEKKDTVIKQDRSGKLRRNDSIVITLSLGDIDSLEPVELIDFSNMTKFETSLWLKRHGIKHEFKYEFSDTVDRHKVISQEVKAGTIVKPFDEKVAITISKGKKIIVPDLTKMSVSEVTEWIMARNLTIRFSDKYDDTIKLGDVISSNYKPGSEVEEETEIGIVISRGQLKMEEFSSLYNFREWASKYNIKTEESYEFNNEVARGNIISFSYNKGDIIPNDATIKVTISHGRPVTIPNFYGKTWSSIQSTCRSIGLYCSYRYGDYSAVAKDSAVSQSKRSGSVVVGGTSVVVTLSKGPAATFTLVLQDSWYSYGSADSSITSLKRELGNRYPGVTFSIVKKLHNTANSGMPHPDSPTKTGTIIKQGQTYIIWVVQ
ncbi:MAG: PASTA domain-containing protein [Bacilli bacterium]|nr:PASTA domain-containing protein [Bacilli bacterium]